MRNFVLLAGIALILGLVGCATVAVNYDYDEEANFSQYQTYKIIAYKRGPGYKPLRNNSLLMTRLERAVDNELAKKGYKKVKRGKADFLVAFHVGVQNKVDVTTYGYRTWRSPYVRTHKVVHRYKEGTVVIDIVDRKEKALVWRGWAQGVLTPAGLGQEEIDDIIHKVLREYPPEEKG